MSLRLRRHRADNLRRDFRRWARNGLTGPAIMSVPEPVADLPIARGPMGKMELNEVTCLSLPVSPSRRKPMRALVLVTLLLASSSLSSFAQGEGKAPISPPQAVPTQPAPSDQNGQQPRDQRTDRGQSKGDEREMGRDWRMRRNDGDRGRDDRDMGPDMRRGDRDEYRDRDTDRGRYGDRDDRGPGSRGPRPRLSKLR